MKTHNLRVRNMAGFTLVEALVALVIVTILLTIAAPSFLTTRRADDTRNATETVVSTLNLAKNFARARSTPVTVNFDGSTLKLTAADSSETLEVATLPKTIKVKASAVFQFTALGSVKSGVQFLELADAKSGKVVSTVSVSAIGSVTVTNG